MTTNARIRSLHALKPAGSNDPNLAQKSQGVVCIRSRAALAPSAERGTAVNRRRAKS
jgi:hypothetical protein